MAGVLEGLKVLDLTWGSAGPMATMLLADHGAEVTRIERPSGDPFPRPEGYRVWNRGKRAAQLDLKSQPDREAFLALVRTADILVESFAPGVTHQLGIDYETLAPSNPRLIHCSITGYGRDNRHSNRPAYDQLVAARCGVQWEARGWFGSAMDHVIGRDAESASLAVPEAIRIGSDREGPIFTATSATSVLTAYLAVLGVSAALRARDVTGAGQHVETSFLQALIQGQGCSWQRPANPDAPGYQFGVIDKRQTWGIVRAADGWMCTWASPAAWFAAAGAGGELSIPNEDQIRRTGGMGTIEDRLRDLDETAPTFAKFSVDDWVRIAAESGAVSCQPVRTPEEALCDPALLAEQAVVEIDDPELGVLRQAGQLYRLHDRPAEITRPAAEPGKHTEAVLEEARRIRLHGTSGPEAPAGARRSLARGPLEGVRVVDFGLAVAGPWASNLLADLGADVLKVDPIRQAYWMPCHMAIGVNRSKRCIGLDVKTEAGQEIAERLVRDADIVVLNMRPQAARKLGLDFDTLHALNPRLIYCHTRGFEDGPRSQLPGNDQTGNALGGTLWEDGGCWDGGRPWFGTTSNGDLGNGFFAAIAMVQALYDRERSGKGQQVDASILNAALFNNSRVYTNRDGERFDRLTLDRDQLGLHALYRLYRCREDWLCIAVFGDEAWAALSRSIPELTDDLRFASSSKRTENEAALRTVLEAAFETRDANDWFEILDAAGVPCEISSATFSQTLFDDPELLERGWVVHREGNPVLGPIDMFGIGVDFSATPSQAGGPPAIPWQHTRLVLAELGYSRDEIESLCESGVAIPPAIDLDARSPNRSDDRSFGQGRGIPVDGSDGAGVRPASKPIS